MRQLRRKSGYWEEISLSITVRVLGTKDQATAADYDKIRHHRIQRLSCKMLDSNFNLFIKLIQSYPSSPSSSWPSSLLLRSRTEVVLFLVLLLGWSDDGEAATASWFCWKEEGGVDFVGDGEMRSRSVPVIIGGVAGGAGGVTSAVKFVNAAISIVVSVIELLFFSFSFSCSGLSS